MTYIFDNGSLSKLKHFYPQIFQSVWTGLDQLIATEKLISTREVWNEMQNGQPHITTTAWLKQRQKIFMVPTGAELSFVAEIFRIPHFRTLIGEKEQLRGTPVADPFVIAVAKVRGGTVVTEELFKPNASKIPNVCAHFNVPCITLEGFMNSQSWKF